MALVSEEVKMIRKQKKLIAEAGREVFVNAIFLLVRVVRIVYNSGFSVAKTF